MNRDYSPDIDLHTSCCSSGRSSAQPGKPVDHVMWALGVVIAFGVTFVWHEVPFAFMVAATASGGWWWWWCYNQYLKYLRYVLGFRVRQG